MDIFSKITAREFCEHNEMQSSEAIVLVRLAAKKNSFIQTYLYVLAVVCAHPLPVPVAACFTSTYFGRPMGKSSIQENKSNGKKKGNENI